MQGFDKNKLWGGDRTCGHSPGRLRRAHTTKVFPVGLKLQRQTQIRVSRVRDSLAESHHRIPLAFRVVFRTTSVEADPAAESLAAAGGGASRRVLGRTPWPHVFPRLPLVRLRLQRPVPRRMSSRSVWDPSLGCRGSGLATWNALEGPKGSCESGCKGGYLGAGEGAPEVRSTAAGPVQRRRSP